MSGQDLARAIHAANSRTVANGQSVRLAEVVGVSPLSLEALDSPTLLDEDDISLSQDVQAAYDDIEVEDLVVLARRGSTHIAVAVVSESDPPARVAKSYVDAQDTALGARVTTVDSRVTGVDTRLAAVEAATPFVFATDFSGGWVTTDPPPTSGIAFTLPRAGTVLLDCYATAYVATAGQGIRIEIWVDGVYTGKAMALNATVGTFDRRNVSIKLTRTLTSGVHRVQFKQTSGVSDASDVGSFSVTLP